LHSPWKRVLLVVMVIPLGILRNGLRILVIGMLCVHQGPDMIHSPVHLNGGPYFFALSLIPLFALLWFLRRGEHPRPASGGATKITESPTGNSAALHPPLPGHSEQSCRRC
jgi:exosortase/archaeosortase family protein